MEEKSIKTKYTRKKKNTSETVSALTEAQKIAFAPFTFQIVVALLEFGLLQSLNECPKTRQQLAEACNVSRYAVDTLFDAAVCIGLVNENPDLTYSNTKLAEAFLFDEMTRVNFNFVRDICCIGVTELTQSLRENKPLGLQKHYFDSPTIYQVLTKLNDKMIKSWCEFDHHYSDDCFDEILRIIFEKKTSVICDIGGNTGKFEKACLDFDKNCTIVMLDLPENIAETQKNFNTERCKFVGANILSDEKLSITPHPDAFLMSQFLDCFSKEQVLFILNKIADASDENTRIFILEPFIDNQLFDGAAYALAHISLYFACMANGCSKMYKETEMRELIEQSKLKIKKTYYNIGKYDFTFLECQKR